MTIVFESNITFVIMFIEYKIIITSALIVRKNSQVEFDFELYILDDIISPRSIQINATSN